MLRYIFWSFFEKKKLTAEKTIFTKEKASGNFLKIKVKSVNNIINNIVLTLS